jgi:hypothetical protein
VITFGRDPLFGVITEENEANGRGGIAFSIPATSVDYLDPDGSVSDIVTHTQFTVAFFSDLSSGNLQQPQPPISQFASSPSLERKEYDKL